MQTKLRGFTHFELFIFTDRLQGCAGISPVDVCPRTIFVAGPLIEINQLATLEQKGATGCLAIRRAFRTWGISAYGKSKKDKADPKAGRRFMSLSYF
jgi:hypothetical protein